MSDTSCLQKFQDRQTLLPCGLFDPDHNRHEEPHLRHEPIIFVLGIARTRLFGKGDQQNSRIKRLVASVKSLSGDRLGIAA
jgi:hypothetical protein